jgi:hypothetical protein
MTSTTALAHAATTAPPPMTAATIAFYATAATIIPVLYIAIAVQGPAYQNLISAMADIDRRRDSNPQGYWRPILLTAVSAVLFVAAVLILTYGVLSEIDAIYALYQQQARNSTAQAVLIGVIILTIATAAGPALTFVRYNYKFITQAGQDAPEDTTPNVNPEPEPDKPDPAQDQK